MRKEGWCYMYEPGGEDSPALPVSALAVRSPMRLKWLGRSPCSTMVGRYLPGVTGHLQRKATVLRR